MTQPPAGFGWAPRTDIPRSPSGSGPDPYSVVVRTYRGNQHSATAAFQQDAARMAQSGYFPATQTWSDGSWGCGAFLLALILCVVLVGFLIFVYLLIVKPAGTLTVTYQRR